jgi:hypothetical protein
MSTVIENTTQQDFQERSILATRKLCEALNLKDLKSTELKYLSTALAEVAIQEIAHNRAFGETLIATFQTLIPPKKEKKAASTKRSSGNKKTSPDIALPQPIKNIPISEINPYGTPDILLLQEAYGYEQLPAVLQTFTVKILREIAGGLQEKLPDKKIKKSASKEEALTYIIATLPLIK